MTQTSVRAPEAKAELGDAQSVAESFEEFMEAFEIGRAHV